jgi:hypothetical protein
VEDTGVCCFAWLCMPLVVCTVGETCLLQLVATETMNQCLTIHSSVTRQVKRVRITIVAVEKQ